MRPLEPLTQPLPKALEVHLVVGALDSAETRRTRALLRELCRRPALRLAVDLSELDDQHELTMFALIARAARDAQGRGGRVTAVRPPARMVAGLTALAIPIQRTPLDPLLAEQAIAMGVRTAS